MWTLQKLGQPLRTLLSRYGPSECSPIGWKRQDLYASCDGSLDVDCLRRGKLLGEVTLQLTAGRCLLSVLSTAAAASPSSVGS